MSANYKLMCVTLVALAATSSVHAQDLFEQAVAESEAKQPSISNEERADQLYFSSRFVVDDTDPVKSVPTPREQNANPVDFGYFVTSLFQKGNAAAQRGEHENAVKYYTALAKAIPAGALPLRNLCSEYRALGKLDMAQKACGLALARNGTTVDDSVQYVQLVVAQAAELTPEQVADTEAVIEHLGAQNPPRATVQDLKCRLGARLLDASRLQACTGELQKLNVPAEKISTYVWALAMLRGDTDEAKRQLELARSSGLQGEALSSMVDATGSDKIPITAVSVIALLLMAAGAGAFLWQHRRART